MIPETSVKSVIEDPENRGIPSCVAKLAESNLKNLFIEVCENLPAVGSGIGYTKKEINRACFEALDISEDDQRDVSSQISNFIHKFGIKSGQVSGRSRLYPLETVLALIGVVDAFRSSKAISTYSLMDRSRVEVLSGIGDSENPIARVLGDSSNSQYRQREYTLIEEPVINKEGKELQRADVAYLSLVSEKMNRFASEDPRWSSRRYEPVEIDRDGNTLKEVVMSHIIDNWNLNYAELAVRGKKPKQFYIQQIKSEETLTNGEVLKRVDYSIFSLQSLGLRNMRELSIVMKNFEEKNRKRGKEQGPKSGYYSGIENSADFAQ